MQDVATKVRFVSARALSRRMATLLDEIDSERLALIVLRHGRPAAMILPFQETEDAIRLPRFSSVATVAHESHERPEVGPEPAMDLTDVEDDQRQILRDIAACPYNNWVPPDRGKDTIRQVMWLVRLELMGLIVKNGPGYVLTIEGRAALRQLERDAVGTLASG